VRNAKPVLVHSLGIRIHWHPPSDNWADDQADRACNETECIVDDIRAYVQACYGPDGCKRIANVTVETSS